MEVDRGEYVCSSSSADSIAGDSNDKDVGYTEEVIEAEGRELVLIPRREVRVKRGLNLGTSTNTIKLNMIIWLVRGAPLVSFHICVLCSL